MPLHAQQTGNGKDIVLVHGWGMHSSIFQPLVDALADRYRLTLIDLPGHGQSDDPKECNQQYYLEQLLAIAPQQAAWVGWSLGGMLVTALAHHYPENVNAVVLLSSSPRFTASNDWQYAMSPAVLQEFGVALQQDAEATIKRFLSLVSRGAPNQEVLRELRKQVLAERLPSKKGLSCGMRFLEWLDVRQPFSELSMPVLAIMGERDTLVPVDVSKDMKFLNSQLELVVIEQAGHAPFLSHTDQCAQSIKDFLQ